MSDEEYFEEFMQLTENPDTPTKVNRIHAIARYLDRPGTDYFICLPPGWGRSSDAPNRIVVDPNAFARRNPAWSVCAFEDAVSVPAVGDEVLAIVPYDDEPDATYPAVVHDINIDYELIYLEVEWNEENQDHNS